MVICSLTYNLLPMLAEAGFTVRECNYRCSADVLLSLIAAYGRLLSDPERFEALNPPTGWGSYKGLLEAIPRWLSILADGSSHSRLEVY